MSISSFKLSRLRPAAHFLVIVVLVGAAVWVLQRQLQFMSWSQIIASAEATPPWRIGLSAILTAISFCALASYDAVAARIVVPRQVPNLAAAFAGAVANAVSNMLGFHAITGSAVRYRIYRHWRVSVADITRIISLSGTSLGLGILATLTTAFLYESWTAAPDHAGTLLACGLMLFFILAGFLVWLAMGSRTIGYGRFRLNFPGALVTALQMAIGAIETGATIGALYILLPESLTPAFSIFAVAFIGSVLLGIASHAPGGVGVFEAAMISLFPTGHAELLAALLLFRLIYNVAPFILALLGMSIFEMLKTQQVNWTEDIAG